MRHNSYSLNVSNASLQFGFGLTKVRGQEVLHFKIVNCCCFKDKHIKKVKKGQNKTSTLKY